jgi:hypothetical protein
MTNLAIKRIYSTLWG